MKITLENIGKRFKRNWIFRDVNLEFVSGKSYALTGVNGSGKSTLLKTVAGFIHPNKGELTIIDPSGKQIDKNDFAFHYTFCSPYQELIREMKLNEFLDFHQKLTEELDTKLLLETVNLSGNEDKLIDNFSSGMIQRLKLGITFFTQRPVILLDEPTSTLDIYGKEIFQSLFLESKKSKLIVMASNEKDEYSLCDSVINIQNYQ